MSNDTNFRLAQEEPRELLASATDPKSPFLESIFGPDLTVQGSP